MVPSYTFIASVSAILWAGFEPVFVDVEPDGWHVDPISVERAADRFGESIALIMSCSTFGTLQPDDLLTRLRAIAQRIGAPLLVDSAAGFGSTLPDGRHRGCDGDLDVYSFHATKPFAIGEGGLVVAPDLPTAADGRKPRELRGSTCDTWSGTRSGLTRKWTSGTVRHRSRYSTTSLPCLRRRRARSDKVKAALAPHGYASQAGSELASNQFIAVLAPSAQVRANCLQTSRDRGIEFRAYYRDPLHSVAPLRHLATADDLPVTGDLAQRALSLPLANDLSQAHLDEVIEVCIDAATSQQD